MHPQKPPSGGFLLQLNELSLISINHLFAKDNKGIV
jgi:hypothetical protein